MDFLRCLCGGCCLLHSCISRRCFNTLCFSGCLCCSLAAVVGFLLTWYSHWVRTLYVQSRLPRIERGNLSMAKGSVRKKGKKWYALFYIEGESARKVQKEFVGTKSKFETEALLRKAICFQTVRHLKMCRNFSDTLMSVQQ